MYYSQFELFFIQCMLIFWRALRTLEMNSEHTNHVDHLSATQYTIGTLKHVVWVEKMGHTDLMQTLYKHGAHNTHTRIRIQDSRQAARRNGSERRQCGREFLSADLSRRVERRMIGDAQIRALRKHAANLRGSEQSTRRRRMTR
jgi:hypothetical protein